MSFYLMMTHLGECRIFHVFIDRTFTVKLYSLLEIKTSKLNVKFLQWHVCSEYYLVFGEVVAKAIKKKQKTFISVLPCKNHWLKIIV